jgi:hypothetical protein
MGVDRMTNTLAQRLRDNAESALEREAADELERLRAWEARFRWLWRNATDGFSTPEGWYPGHYMEQDIPEKDIRMIDEYIENEKSSV